MGQQKIPVVLVEFADKTFQVAETQEEVNQFYNLFCNGNKDGTRYEGAGSYGAVRDYFVDQSAGQFLPEFEVIGPVRLGKDYAYYGQNDDGGNDLNISVFVSQAVLRAQEIYQTWDDFDNNGDGVVDMIFFIYAGEGENGCEDENTIWPHEKVTEQRIANVRFGAYGCCNELYIDKVDGIGVMCHELSHALGLPDLYDTSGYEYGLDYWDIMDSGCYCKDSYHPCGYSAYEKEFMGWQQFRYLTRDEEKTITLIPVSEGGVGYRIENVENSNEYYILENRQNTGWDRYIGHGTSKYMAHGLMVSHIDYSTSKWRYNNVNTDKNHPYYSIIAADDTHDAYGDIENAEQFANWFQSTAGDLFPGTYGVTSLPSSRQFVYTSSGSMRQPITCIEELEDGTISFVICRFADVNEDGVVDTQDVLSVYEGIQEDDTLNTYIPADVNMDMTVDTQDVLRIYDYMNQK